MSSSSGGGGGTTRRAGSGGIVATTTTNTTTSAKSVVTAERSHQLHLCSSNIAGTAEGLRRRLRQLDDELKADREGAREFEAYLATLADKRGELVARIERNKAWIANFDADDSSAFEAQYTRLLGEIKTIYEHAKEFHQQGIEMLIRDFGYHVAYKRWCDTFTAIPFKPK